MEFNILKGRNLSKFNGSEYVGALFFDLSTNTIYLGTADETTGKVKAVAMDQASFSTMELLDAESGRINHTYSFKSSASSEAISISDAAIPNIDEENWDGKDTNATYLKLGTGTSGLMNSVDKYVLDKIAEALGITTEYYEKTNATGETTNEVRFKMDLSNLASLIAQSSNKFDGGGSASTLATLTSHGNLPKGTTIEDLEKMSYSEVLKAILFETALPTKRTSLAASVSFKSPYNTTVDVGRDYPTLSNMDKSFTSEQWNWTSADGSASGTIKSLNVFSAVKYYYNTTNSTTINGNTVELTDNKVGADKKVVEGTNGYFFGVLDYTAGDNAVDSLGNELIEENKGAAYSGSKTTSTISFNGAWRVYSNAAASSTSETTAKAWGNVTPSVSKSVVNAETNMSTEAGITNHGFNATGFYAAWAPQTSAGYSNTDEYVLYVPNSKSVKSIKAYNGATGKYDVAITVPTPTTLTLNNGYVNGTFKVYKFNNNGSLLNYYFTIG